MKIVAVTACPAGIAHLYLAAAKLERAAIVLGHQIKVEMQGAMGIENKLTEQDIHQAQAVLFAVDIDVEQRERFKGIEVIQVPLREVIRRPQSVLIKVQRSHDERGVG